MKLYRLNPLERLLHLTRCLLTFFCAFGMIGMIIAMKVFKMKALSSTFELILACGFMLFLMTFANQLQHVNITISAEISKVRGVDGVKGTTTLELGTTLEIDGKAEDKREAGAGRTGDHDAKGGGGATHIGPYNVDGGGGEGERFDDDFSFPNNWSAAGGEGGYNLRSRSNSGGVSGEFFQNARSGSEDDSPRFRTIRTQSLTKVSKIGLELLEAISGIAN